MSAVVFFEAERLKFFRPLNSSRRELVAACLRALYERSHGPVADYHNLNRENLKELILPVVRDYQDKLDAEVGQDEFSTSETVDPQQLTSVVIKVLLRDGWLEQFPDRQGLVTAFRFSRPGMLFAEAFWSLHHPSRSRQRNMRGCRNALTAALSDRGDAHDLADAYEYAKNVIKDLNEGIDSLQERVRHLMREATIHAQWDEFVEFLDRFKRDYSKQLTADSAILNRRAIREKLESLRVSLPDAKYQRMEDQLHDIGDLAQLASKERPGSSVLEWLLDRIEYIVNAACDSKQPGFVKAMDTYLKRVTGLVQQSMMLHTGQTRHAYLRAVKRIAELDTPGQEKLLARIGEQLTSVEVRLLDPSSFKLRSATARRKAVTVSLRPRESREARLAAAMRRAESEAFSLANEELAQRIRSELRLYKHPIRLSSRPVASAQDVLGTLQAVEAVRNTAGRDLEAKRLARKVENEAFSSDDYEINFRK